MRVIALEEHCSAPGLPTHVPGRTPEVLSRLRDLGEARLADMDAAGIDLQVLSPSFRGTHSGSSAVAGWRFLDAVPLSPADRDKLTHLSTEALLGL
ncbi:MAG: hypothetical protein M0Z46_00105 [Actinomycetota bacterium]|jgi:hypothetical protein|nr:hypothetical protein [Actinomycetota bacterium]